MKQLGIGKLRGLQQIASRRGTFTVLALDHRQNLRKANPVFADDRELSRFKLEAISNLASEATGVLLDPEVSAAQAVAQGVLPRETGLIVAVESTGYTGDVLTRHAQIIPGWSVEKAKRMGASAIKLLVYYHPESPTAQEKENLVANIGRECIRHDIVFMLEPLSYPLVEGKKLSSGEKRHLVVETVRRLSPLNVDILKAEFPLDADETDESMWKEAYGEISSASVTPWILLSGAADYERYLHQVTAACNAGASGIAVGRAVWQEAVSMTGVERSSFLRQEAVLRLSRLASLCKALAKPFTDFYTANAPFEWYKNY